MKNKITYQDERLKVVKGVNDDGNFIHVFDNLFITEDNKDGLVFAADSTGLIKNNTGFDTHAYFDYSSLITDYIVQNRMIDELG